MLITSGSVCWVKNIVPAAGYPTGKLLTEERITFPQEEHLVTGKWLILEWNEPSASDKEVFLLTHVLLKMESPPLSHQCPIGRSRAVLPFESPFILPLSTVAGWGSGCFAQSSLSFWTVRSTFDYPWASPFCPLEEKEQAATPSIIAKGTVVQTSCLHSHLFFLLLSFPFLLFSLVSRASSHLLFHRDKRL